MPPRNPWEIPTGYYDPALDAQQRAAGRGYGDLRQDTELADARAAQDYGFGVEDYTRQRDRGIQDIQLGTNRGLTDLGRQRERGGQDLSTQRGWAGEDYRRDVGLLQRSYKQLGRRQGEGNRGAGVLSQGLLGKQMMVRAENQAIDRQPIDTGYNRFLHENTTARSRMEQDFTTGTGRLREDAALGAGRLNEDATTGIGRLGVDYGRGVFDRGTALGRAGRENIEFGQDIGAQKAFQAGQMGWIPPDDPRKKKKPGGGTIGLGGWDQRYANDPGWR